MCSLTPTLTRQKSQNKTGLYFLGINTGRAGEARAVANTILIHNNRPMLKGALVDVDVWPHLSNALGRRVLVLDSWVSGRLYEPSLVLIGPGEQVEVTDHGCLASGRRWIPLRETVAVLRHGFLRYTPVYWSDREHHSVVGRHCLRRRMQRWMRRFLRRMGFKCQCK